MLVRRGQVLSILTVLFATIGITCLVAEGRTVYRQLDAHYPLRAAHVMSIVQDIRGGRDNDPRFGFRMHGQGQYAELFRKRFEMACKRLGLNAERDVPLDTTLFRPPRMSGQLDLF